MFKIEIDYLLIISCVEKIVCDKSTEILETECDMAALYTLIAKFPTKIEDIEVYEVLIKKAINLYTQYPPEILPKLIEFWQDKWYVNLKKKLMLNSLLSHFLIYSKKIQNEQLQAKESETMLRHRAFKRRKEEEFDSKMITRRKLDNKTTRNKFLMGFLTIGVAATAAYVFTTSPKEPEDIFMKFFHLLAYK
jgi:hypothetical protein